MVDLDIKGLLNLEKEFEEKQRQEEEKLQQAERDRLRKKDVDWNEYVLKTLNYFPYLHGYLRLKDGTLLSEQNTAPENYVTGLAHQIFLDVPKHNRICIFFNQNNNNVDCYYVEESTGNLTSGFKDLGAALYHASGHVDLVVAPLYV